uniref:3-oxoacyl-[acyl-carrier-protein] reductase n=1 Tax=Steinernema glaseri TaxID=37863 RepID=A0A1I7Z5W8_9BILA
MSRFVGKVAIVTGSSSGIGQAAAVLLASEGASVTIHGRSADGLKTTENLILEKGIPSERIVSVQGSIQDDKVLTDLIHKTLEKFGRIDVLVNNAGSGGLPGMDRSSIEAFDFIHSVNIKPVIQLTRLVEPHLEKTKGNIVNVSSIAALLPRPGAENYAMSKAALDHFMRSRTHELAKKGIRINNVNPGLVETNFHLQMGISEQNQEKFRKGYSKIIPMGRPGAPVEIAKPIAFLASSDASYITGVCLVADGGVCQFVNKPEYE